MLRVGGILHLEPLWLRAPYVAYPHQRQQSTSQEIVPNSITEREIVHSHTTITTKASPQIQVIYQQQQPLEHYDVSPKTVDLTNVAADDTPELGVVSLPADHATLDVAEEETLILHDEVPALAIQQLKPEMVELDEEDEEDEKEEHVQATEKNEKRRKSQSSQSSQSSASSNSSHSHHHGSFVEQASWSPSTDGSKKGRRTSIISAIGSMPPTPTSLRVPFRMGEAAIRRGSVKLIEKQKNMAVKLKRAFSTSKRQSV